MNAQVVVVDHYDSYTWNLVHLVARVTGELPQVVEHDQPGVIDVVAAASHVVLSPGPGHPANPVDFALGAAVFGLGTPVLGVCLGMQALVTAYGGRVDRVDPAHGEVALVEHRGVGVLAGIPSPFEAVRYHSLAAVEVPDELEVTAIAGGVVMAVRHRSLALEGVQFHPESVLSTHGEQLVRTFLGVGMTGAALDAVRAGFARSDRVFWLDGGGSQDWSGRRSLVGVLDEEDVSLSFDGVRREVTRHRGGSDEVVGEDIFAVLEDEVARDAGDPDVHWVGCLGYASRTDLPSRCWSDGPDAVWMRCRAPLLFEGVVVAGRPSQPVISVNNPDLHGNRAAPRWYADAFARVQEELHAGNSYEVNLTYREEVAAGLDPLETYLRLRASNPAPYAGLLRHRGTHLLSSSPERFATIDRHRRLETRPIKGTTPRGATPEEDERLRTELARDPKCRAENLMIVDLLRNDLSVVCEVGSVEVPSLMAVESYASVHQLVSTVRGTLRDDVSTVEALRTLFPAGSMTGAPKLRTMEVIDQVEATPRGWYAGAFGWICADGRADLGVVIRSLYAGPQGPWCLGTGGGITVLSEVGEEWRESLWKAERLRAAASAR